MYKPVLFRLLLVSVYFSISICSFSQQKFTDSTATETDGMDDAVEIVDTTGNYQDSVDRVNFNYYNDTSAWPSENFLLRRVPDSVVRSLQGEDDFWYANKEIKKKKEEHARGMNLQGWLAGKKWYRVLAWVIVISGFLAVLIWYLASMNAGIFSRRSRIIDSSGESGDEGNIFDINYQQDIELAIQAGNYRLAVRLMFLRALKNLAEKNVVQLKHGRTNYDYLVQLNNTTYYKDFSRLTRHYEYTWYGGFGISNQAFTIMQTEFENFDRQLY